MKKYGSKDIARAALRMALTESHEEEQLLQKEFAEKGISGAATDFGGNYLNNINKIIERALSLAKRQDIILGNHYEEGAVAGATRDALAQLMTKASGLDVGGKLSVVRYEEHLSVAIFMSIGLYYLDEIAVGLAHRTVHRRTYEHSDRH